MQPRALVLSSLVKACHRWVEFLEKLGFMTDVTTKPVLVQRALLALNPQVVFIIVSRPGDDEQFIRPIQKSRWWHEYIVLIDVPGVPILLHRLVEWKVDAVFSDFQSLDEPDRLMPLVIWLKQKGLIQSANHFDFNLNPPSNSRQKKSTLEDYKNYLKERKTSWQQLQKRHHVEWFEPKSDIKVRVDFEGSIESHLKDFVLKLLR